MRNLIIVLLLIFIFVFGTFLSDRYISSIADYMAREIDSVSSREDITALTEEWKKKSVLAELVLDHSEVDLLNQYLWAMEEEIECDFDEFMESKKLAKEKNISILSSLHDLNQALAFGDKFFFMKDGVVKYAGGKEIVTEAVIKDIFDIDVRIVEIENHKVILGGNYHAS
jgi:ABC-type cobalamin/Fe3+-siderophores transport system ATPase subunit